MFAASLPGNLKLRRLKSKRILREVATPLLPASILTRITYHHPVFSPAAIAAQQRHGEINGSRRTFYCGAYWGFGFHEDGVNSALTASRALAKEDA